MWAFCAMWDEVLKNWFSKILTCMHLHKVCAWVYAQVTPLVIVVITIWAKFAIKTSPTICAKLLDYMIPHKHILVCWQYMSRSWPHHINVPATSNTANPVATLQCLLFIVRWLQGWEYPRDSLVYVRELGEGQFGKVLLMRTQAVSAHYVLLFIDFVCLLLVYLLACW